MAKQNELQAKVTQGATAAAVAVPLPKPEAEAESAEAKAARLEQENKLMHEELKWLRQQQDEMQAALKAGTTPAASAPIIPGVRRKFRVRLPECKVLVTAADGRRQYQDFLDIDATHPQEAWHQFQIYNGIKGTTHQPEIAEAPAA